jgi:hypothetical protein
MTTTRIPLLAPAAIVATLLTAMAGSAHAAVPNACGLVTQFQIAHAFGLSDAIKHTKVTAPPGNPSGALRVHCRVFSWDGPKPTNDKRKREALLAGRLAWLNVDTWVADQSPSAPAWRSRFNAELKAIRAAAVDLFLRRLHGSAFVPPRYGADEAIAYRGETRKTVKVRALWWKRSDKSLLEMNIEEDKGKPAIASLKRLASQIAERFNTECVFPCEPPATG